MQNNEFSQGQNEAGPAPGQNFGQEKDLGQPGQPGAEIGFGSGSQGYSAEEERSRAEEMGSEIMEDSRAGERSDYKAKIEKEIIVHTMPEKFRVNHGQSKKAKTTGLIILAGGFILIMAAFALVYFFMLRDMGKKSQEATILEQKATQEDKPSSPEGPAGSGQSQNLPEPENGEESQANQGGFLEEAEEAATSSPELPDQTEEEATSTPEEAGNLPTDLDSDGLFDQEENLIGANMDSQDSDGDGYGDLAELMSLYNPAGSGKLIDNPNISQYKNLSFHYSFYYPTGWNKVLVGGDDSVMFQSADGHFLQAIVQSNPEKEDIQNWYQRQFEAEILGPERLINLDNWWGIKNQDGLTIYITDAKREYIFALSYIAGNRESPVYKNIFEMAIRSFVVE